MDGPGRFRAAVVHVLLDFRRGQPELFFLPRRPPSFPAVFDDGSHVFAAAEQGWYDQVLRPPTTDRFWRVASTGCVVAARTGFSPSPSIERHRAPAGV